MHSGFVRRNRAFTLIELLVVVAILALLMSILLPSLQAAREQARRVVCGTTLNGFGKMLALYGNEYNDWMPGVNTSGVAVQELYFPIGSNDYSDLQQANMPVQSFDWMTPLVRMSEPDLPASRAERWEYVWQQRYACPSRLNVTSKFYDETPDQEDFEKIGTWKACSYLSPVYFHLWGEGTYKQRLGTMKGIGWAVNPRRVPDYWDVANPKNFRSRIDRIGSAGRKVFAADGTRYLPSTLHLDHDHTALPDTFGAFTSAGAWRGSGTAYGVARDSESLDGRTIAEGSPSDGKNLPLSYRHGRPSAATTATANQGLMEALFFDGHVAGMNDRASRDIHLWYPSGAIVNQNANGMTYSERESIIP